MNKIILVRHGEPDVCIKKKISGKEIPSFLKIYNTAVLKSGSLPSPRLIFLANNATVVCSHLKRSVCSAQRCDAKPEIIDPVFAESIPPHFQNNLFKLGAKQWLMLSRFLWMIGFSLHGESLIATKERAARAAQILLDEVEKKDVILFGHGLFNIMIASELQKKGYIGPKVPARNFWEYGIYKFS